MKPPDCVPETGMDDRRPRRRPEPAHTIADENLPLDHHVEEVLAALSDLAGLSGMQPGGGEGRA